MRLHGRIAAVKQFSGGLPVSSGFQGTERSRNGAEFAQRFAGEVANPAGLRQFTTVLAHCPEGAKLRELILKADIVPGIPELSEAFATQ